MSQLRRTYEGSVPPEEIDHLGHMNVRFYATKARAASASLLADYGLSPDACAERGVRMAIPDAFTLHLREQLEGARLVVDTGVLSVDEEDSGPTTSS